MRFSLPLRVLTGAALFALTAGTTRGAVVAYYYLAGQNVMSGDKQGTYTNPTHRPQLIGTNTTSASLNYDGHWKVRLKTSSIVENTTLSGGQLQEATASLDVSTIGQFFGPGPYPPTLTYVGHLSGTVKVGTNSFHDGSLHFGSLTIDSLEDLFFPSSGAYPINLPFTATVPVSPTGVFPIDLSLRSESWGRLGETFGDFESTLELTSILLPNGHKPESEGWTLSFDDGSMSPNVGGPGDVNFDGVVNIFDVNLVSAHWGESGPAGDANGDMMVDIFDVNMISSNWSPPQSSPVPEPSTITLAMIEIVGVLAVVAGRTRRIAAW